MLRYSRGRTTKRFRKALIYQDKRNALTIMQSCRLASLHGFAFSFVPRYKDY